MNVVIKQNAKYRMTFEWVREERTVVTEWMRPNDVKRLIDLCNANPIKIHNIEEQAA